MGSTPELFCFRVDDQRYAFPLLSVDRIIQAVAVHTVPNAPPLLYGFFDYFGMLIPVINFRYRLNLPTYPIRACDYFIIVDTPVRKLALVIEDVGEVIRVSDSDLFPSSFIGGDHVSGIFRRDDGIILIYDLEALVSKQEEVIVQELVEHVAKNKPAHDIH